MSAHPGSEALELYVVGAHDLVAAADVEAHLRVCSDCTEEVRRQVQMDMALAEVALDARFCPGCGALYTMAPCPHCGAVAEVGGFRIEKVIVQGARGRIYLARDEAGQPVALKELAFVQPPRPEAIESFEREARLLRQLAHPQIPRFLAAFREGEGVNTRLYLAQEYVAGESLLARLGHHQFSEAEARQVAAEVLAILAYLQSLAPMVFHRDIKPANLIQRPDGRIALVDFGAARDLGPTSGATLVGTFGYMPIEQMGGIVDATTDLYALGATLCHLLSRREPWSFLEDPGALDRLNVSPAFRAYLGRLMARRPADRFPSAAAAAAALQAPAPLPPRPRSRPQVPLGAALAIGSALLLALGGGIAFKRMRAQRRAARQEVRIERTVRNVHIETDVVKLSPKAGNAQLAIDPSQTPYRLVLPKDVVPEGGKVSAQLEICVDATGQVAHVVVKKSAEPSVDAALVETIKRWKYHPYVIDGSPAPFCTSLRYELRK